MKVLFKIIVTLTAMLACIYASAEGVSEQKAAETAAAFFSKTDAKRVSGLKAVGEKKSAGETPAYRAYNRDGGGFVVIAGDDSVEPVLAYSLDGTFPAEDEMPANMAWWFGMISGQIKSIPSGTKASAEVQSRWESPAATSKKAASSLLYDTALWGQRTPFNNKCPESGNTRCVTGCVATAGAIIAHYYRWPDRGVGTIPARENSNSGAYYPEHTLGYDYDWDNMLTEYGKNYSDAQADAVATLMYDMGTLAKMQYGTSGSSAYSSDLLVGMKEHMKFNKAAYQANRSSYTDAQWIAMIKQTLSDNGPTVYGGSDVNGAGGHAFVVDGYDENDRLHFNWGWKGDGNCYCYVTALIPDGEDYNFANGQDVIINLTPDRDGTTQDLDLLAFSKDDRYSGITTTATSFSQNASFTCRVGWIFSMTGDFSGNFYMALYDKNGNFKQDVSSAINRSIQANRMIGFNASCRITTTIDPGDRIMLRYVGQHNSGIVDIGEDCNTYIIVKEDTGEDPTAGYTAAQIAATTSLSYAKNTGVMTITLQYPANWSVKNSSGTTVASGVATNGGAVTINTSQYAVGKYTISIGSATDPFIFTFTK